MDYKQKYKDNFELAKDWYNDATTTQKEKVLLEAMYPELKESEDERIRKTLIHIVKGACNKYGIKYKGDEITEEKLLAYLERQKEQKPAEWSEEDEKMRRRAICACNFTIDRTFSETHYGEARDWLKSLPIGFITNPNYNSDMVELLVSELQTIANDNGVPKQYDAEITWLKSLRPQPHWKPSEEQMIALLSKLPVVKGSGDKVQDILESLYDDLKKL